jgi:phytoene dehydrogenase-like protein
VNEFQTAPGKSVIVVGGGVAGMSAACAMAEAGLRVKLVERRGYLGGRASSYRHPGVDEVIDNCQHVLFGCCTNLIGFYQRIGVTEHIHWTNAMTMIEPGGRRTLLKPSAWLPAPLHGLPSLLAAKALTRDDKLALARAFRALMRPVPPDSTETLGAWLRRNGQTQGAMERFWRLVIASALNARCGHDCAAVCGKGNSRAVSCTRPRLAAMGMSTVPLERALLRRGTVSSRERGGEVILNASALRAAEWDEEMSAVGAGHAGGRC